DESQVKYVMAPSVTGLPGIMSDDYQMSYDPAYKRGSSKEERGQERHYIRLTRKDTEEYLALVEDNPDLSINEFAAKKLKERGETLKKGEIPIADVSTQIVKFEVTREDAQEFQRLRRDNEDLTVNEFIAEKMRAQGIPEIEGAAIIGNLNPNILNPNNEFDVLSEKEWPQTLSFHMQTDLSGLDLSRCNLQGACFSGANLSGAKFDGANLSNATFEGANLQEAEFIGAKARDANFHAADLTDAVIRESDFTRAYLPFSFGESAQVEKSNFRFADIRNGEWQGVRIDGSDLSYANMEGVVLANADIRRTKMVCANLERAILNGCELVESDLSGAFLKEAEMRKAKIKDTSLQNARAGKIDLSESEIDELSKLDGIQLQEAIMRKVKADNVSFVKANMEAADLEYAQMRGAIVEGANLRFGELHGAVMDGVKGSKVDLTGADLTDVQARGANFREAQLENIKGMRGNFEEAILENANVRAARLEKAIMRKVNAKKADLRDADMQGVDFSGADVEEAVVNDNSDMHKAKIEGVKGELVKENTDGSKEKISVEKQKENSAKIHDAKSKGTLSRIGGKILGVMGAGLKKAGEFIKQPLSTKWGRIIGGVVGALAVAAIVASVVFTAGLSLPVIAAAVGGALLVGGAAGAVGGHFVAKHSGLSTLAMGGVGAVMLPVAPGLGAAAGLAGGAVVNGVAKKVIGQSIDEAVGNGVIAVGDLAKRGEGHFGVSEEQVRLEQAQKRCQENYQAPERDKGKKAEVGGLSFEEVQRQQMKQHGLGPEPERDRPPVKKTALQTEVGQIVERMDKAKPRRHSISEGVSQNPKKPTRRGSLEI
ncbi:MAG: pentapeptide repeat-containing protein, partial [Proteobacteria bacterium]|nr:pentapeptide repeat-containing protein [Pseudomonadota bacterium]